MWKGKANEYFSNNRIILLIITFFPTIKIRKNTLEILKVSDAGRDWGQEEKGTTEDEMAGWHH